MICDLATRPGSTMSLFDGSNGASDQSFRSRKNRSSAYLVLAAGLLIFSAITGASFLLLRPTTLRIAVGPPGSDDQKLIQGLAQAFTSDGSPVRLSVISTAGPVESIALLKAEKADLAVARDDEEMP